MTYPETPWYLQGSAFLTCNLIDTQKARPLIPPELDIVQLWPGKTLGGVYLSTYESGSVLEYHELIVVAGLVRYQGQVGSWISHIYVDNPDSVAGGREIWGLPKELADFEWQGDRIIVRQEQVLCDFSYQPSFWMWQQSIASTSFSHLNGNLIQFKAEAKGRWGLVGAKLQVPPSSPFATLNFDQPWLTIGLQQMALKIVAPNAVERAAIASR